MSHTHLCTTQERTETFYRAWYHETYSTREQCGYLQVSKPFLFMQFNLRNKQGQYNEADAAYIVGY